MRRADDVKRHRYDSMAERLMANSVTGNELTYDGEPCWIWTGKVIKSNGGAPYGVLTIKKSGKVKNVRAHRMSLAVFKKTRLTRRIVGAHLCNVSLCINPHHLKATLQTTNIRQCVADGRHKTPFRKQNREPGED